MSQGLLLLSRAVDALPDQPTAEKLFMYKYPLRFLTESLLANSACSPAAPELQPFTYYYKEIFGKPPSGIKYEALKAANMSSTNMTRMVLVPPKAPPERPCQRERQSAADL